MGLSEIPYADPEPTISVNELHELMQSWAAPPRACWLCRFWQENREDERQPRWGTCLRMGSQPFPLMYALSEDPEMGATFVTHPKFYCSEYSE